jgi:hypothetical protein
MDKNLVKQPEKMRLTRRGKILRTIGLVALSLVSLRGLSSETGVVDRAGTDVIHFIGRVTGAVPSLNGVPNKKETVVPGDTIDKLIYEANGSLSAEQVFAAEQSIARQNHGSDLIFPGQTYQVPDFNNNQVHPVQQKNQG